MVRSLASDLHKHVDIGTWKETVAILQRFLFLDRIAAPCLELWNLSRKIMKDLSEL